MSKYLVSTVRDVEQQTLYEVEADSEEEALDNFYEGEIINVDYDSTGDEYAIEARLC